MDTISHSIHGVIIYRILDLWVIPDGNYWEAYLLFAFMGALPDLIGYYGNLRDSDYSLYNEVHALKWTNPIVYLPPALLHVFLDSFTHGAGKRWWVFTERLYLYIWNIIITLVLCVLLFRGLL